MSCSASSARAATARARVTPPATRRRLASRATRVPSRRHARAEPGARNPYAPSAARRVLARALDGDDPADAPTDALADAPARDLPESITDRPPADRLPDAAFDVDDALSAWILLRYVFLWVVFGYVAAPAWAQARGVRVPADLDPVELALVLAAAEVGKLAAVALMLRSELGPDSPAVPWARDRRGADPPAVARGLAFGILASVAARGVDAALVVVTSLNPTDGASSDALFAALRAAPSTVAFASAVVAPASEELFFRGFLLPATTRRVPAPLAVTLVAALFAVMHFTPSETPALFVAGCAFGAAAAGGGRGALAAATTAHAVYNAGVLAETALDGAG